MYRAEMGQRVALDRAVHHALVMGLDPLHRQRPLQPLEVRQVVRDHAQRGPVAFVARTGQCDVAKVAQQLLENHRAQLGGKPLELRQEGEASMLLDAPESAVAVALGNLIGNAVKYTPSGDVIVRVHRDCVEVVDSGPGLSAEDAAKLFTRGYRGTHAGHSQGGGIGLSIVRRLCALYGWDVQVRPGERQGVVATLSFGSPRDAAQPGFAA